MVLSGDLKNNYVKFPWHASASDSVELEIFVAPDPILFFSEAFSVHTPSELPTKLLPEDVLEFAGGKNLEVLITPSIITSDDSLKALDASDRSCYIEGERKLRFFKVYTSRNCEIECFSNYSLTVCDCVPFEFVRGPDTRVCGLAVEDQDCLEGFKKDFGVVGPTGMLGSCSCLSPCNSVTYDFEIIESRLREGE